MVTRRRRAPSVKRKQSSTGRKRPAPQLSQKRKERFRRTFELVGSDLAHLSLERRFLRVNRKL